MNLELKNRFKDFLGLLNYANSYIPDLAQKKKERFGKPVSQK